MRRKIIVNLLTSLAISIVVNFSYLLLISVDKQSSSSSDNSEQVELYSGILKIHNDGYGYLICNNTKADSVYASHYRIGWLKLQDGDSLTVIAEHQEKGHPSLRDVVERNGERFDVASLYHRPSQFVAVLAQIIYYFALSFVIISLLTINRTRYTLMFYLKRMLLCIVAAMALYMVAPVERWRTGELVFIFASGQLLDYMVLLRVVFAVVVSMLYSYIFGLIRNSQEMILENENLKNENLTSRYNMLVSQVNPHFFFNTLNSLSLLVREKHTDLALTYIEQLSYAFRYILQNGQSTLVRLEDELLFSEAYSYLFKTRYADKLFFEIDVEDRLRSYLLPALTLQPLMGNAVKHNTITRQQPLVVKIYTEGDYLIVSNPRRPKLDPEPGMGIGLENLKKRWELITEHSIEIVATEENFTVKMLLQKPSV